MASSTHHAIGCVLLILVSVNYARSQSGAEKAPAATISGKVTIKGKGASGVAVGLVRGDQSGMQHPTRHRALTDDEGNYRITNVPPGKYRVMVAAPGFIPPQPTTERTFLIIKGETIENVDFALGRGGVITGKVTNSDGRPVIEEKISISPVETKQGYTYFDNFTAQTRTDDRGIYRMFGVPPGRYRVAAGENQDVSVGRETGSGYRRTFHPAAADPSEATIIEVSEGGEVTNVDIALARSVVNYSVRGRIIDGDSGQPLANVSYGVERYVSDNYTSGLRTGAVTNKDGEFRLDNLAPGKYAVFFDTPPDSDWRADHLPFEVSDHDVTGLTVRTSRGISISGLIVPDGTADKTFYERLRKARVQAIVSNPGSTRSSNQSATVNADGSFRISGVQPGLVSFWIGGDRLHVVRTERQGIAYPQGIELREREQITGLRLVVSIANGAVQGTVKLESGMIPVGHLATVTLNRLGDSIPMTDSSKSAEVDARGNFFASDLLPGTYDVTASYAPDIQTAWRRTTQQVVVTNGAVVNVTLTIDPNAAPGRP
jgi:protocatechuate 3,4-dioxygenase beta subunit